MRLMEHLDEALEASPETAAFQEAWQPELEALWAARDGLLEQLSPYTASWGLELWEAALGLTAQEGRTQAQRQAQVVAKLRGVGPVTPELIRSVCRDLVSGEVAVTEFCDEYRVVIDFVGVFGVPPNIADVVRELDELLPAHLAWEYVYHFRPYGDLTGYTHGDLAAYTHEQIRGGTLTDGIHE